MTFIFAGDTKKVSLFLLNLNRENNSSQTQI
jgi:hypothetical protein